MTIASVQGPVSAGQTAASTTIVLVLPGGPTQNNFLQSTMFTRSSTATNPTGFTTEVEVVNATEDDRERIAYKVAGASESATVTWTGLTAKGTGSAGSAGSLREWSGLATTTPGDQHASTGRTNTNSLSSGTTPATTLADELVCAGWAVRTLAVSPSYTNSYTAEVAQQDTDVAAVCTLFTAYKIISATGAQESTASWTGSEITIAAIATFKASSGSDITVNPSGFGLTMSLGTPVVAIDAIKVSPTGFNLAMSLGTPTITVGGPLIQPTGFGLAMSLGSMTVQADVTIFEIPGYSLTMSLGSANVQVGGNVTVVATGFGLTMSRGTPATSINAIAILPAGFGLSMSLGSPSTSAGSGRAPRGAWVGVGVH